MKTFLRINIYETQALLYFILGVMLLDRGNGILGGFVIGYGVFTMLSTFVIGIKNNKDLRDFMEKNGI